MVVYPNQDSWNEFYPNEIFVQMGENTTTEDFFSLCKKAKVGSTIYVGNVEGAVHSTSVFKKVGDFEAVFDGPLNMVLVGYFRNNI